MESASEVSSALEGSASDVEECGVAEAEGHGTEEEAVYSSDFSVSEGGYSDDFEQTSTLSESKEASRGGVGYQSRPSCLPRVDEGVPGAFETENPEQLIKMLREQATWKTSQDSAIRSSGLCFLFRKRARAKLRRLAHEKELGNQRARAEDLQSRLDTATRALAKKEADVIKAHSKLERQDGKILDLEEKLSLSEKEARRLAKDRDKESKARQTMEEKHKVEMSRSRREHEGELSLLREKLSKLQREMDDGLEKYKECYFQEARGEARRAERLQKTLEEELAALAHEKSELVKSKKQVQSLVEERCRQERESLSYERKRLETERSQMYREAKVEMGKMLARQSDQALLSQQLTLEKEQVEAERNALSVCRSEVESLRDTTVLEREQNEMAKEEAKQKSRQAEERLRLLRKEREQTSLLMSQVEDSRAEVESKRRQLLERENQLTSRERDLESKISSFEKVLEQSSSVDQEVSRGPRPELEEPVRDSPPAPRPLCSGDTLWTSPEFFEMLHFRATH